MQIRTMIKNNSENIAGLISLAGSSALFFTGDYKSTTAAAVFTTAELTLAKFGHKVGGYSAGAALFAAGDLTLAFSNSVDNGSTLQITLIGMAGAWGIGALRYPFEKAAQKLESEKLQHIADTLPAVCGTGNLALKLPGIFSAVAAKNYILSTAIVAWAISDILAGRLQERSKAIFQYFKDQQETPPEPQ